MMYQNKLVACLKSNGKVLREFKDAVYLPFGSEYSIFLKNLNSVRASASISIDGKDVSEGGSFIVPANGHIDIQRFIKNGNMDKGNSFKFIERTASVENHRGGIQPEDGIIRIEFQYEIVTHHNYFSNDWTKINLGQPARSGDYFGSHRGFTTWAYNAVHDPNMVPMLAPMANTASAYSTNVIGASSVNDAGITVPGSVNNQKFDTVSAFPLDPEKHVIVLKLYGETADGVQIIKPVEVKAKPTCITCNRVNKATASYCSNCGTALTIV